MSKLVVASKDVLVLTEQEMLDKLVELRGFVMRAVNEAQPGCQSASIVWHDLDKIISNLVTSDEYVKLDDATDLEAWDLK
jgi:hypothetical protein